MTMATKKTKKSDKPQISKTEFIRKFDRAVPAKEVVEKGAKAGIDLSANFIYAVRSADAKPKSGRPVGRPPKPAVAKAAGEQLSLPPVVESAPTPTPRKGLARAGTAPSTAAAIDLVLKLGTDGAHKAIDEVVHSVEQLRTVG